MIKQTLIAIFLVSVTLSAGTSLDILQGREGKEILQQLSKVSSIGKDIVSALQLELTSTDENLLDYIIGMLHDLKNQVTEQAANLQQLYDNRQEECMEGTVELVKDIKAVTEEVLEKRELIPSRQTEYDSKLDQKNTVLEENEFYSQELIVVNEQNTRRKAAFEKTRDEHDALSAALEQARTIIRQLVSGSFLQTKTEILAQLTKHADYHSNMKGEHNNKLFAYLMELASDASKHADNAAVESVLEIIDELIQAEESARMLETQNEQTRVGLYVDAVSRLESNLESNKAKLLDLEADMFTVTIKLRELNNSIKDLNEELVTKKQELADHKAYCLSSNADLQNRVDNYAEILKLLNQVILLMEHSSIQGVRNMVEGVSAADVLNEAAAEDAAFVEIDENEDDPSYNPLDN